MTPDARRITRRGMLASVAALVPSARIFARQVPRRRAVVEDGREAMIVDRANAALVEVTEIPARGIPLSLMREAQGIVIVPDLVKAGFVVAGRVGRGILVARNEDGTWSNPVFLGVAGGSIGAQVGASATDMILVFRTRRSVDDFIRANKVTLGAGVSAAAGPVGREIAAQTDARFRAEILTYSRSRGLFAGAAVDGTSLHVRHRANDLYYGVPHLMVGDILAGLDFEDRPLPVPPSAARLKATLAALSAPPEIIEGPADAAPRDAELKPAAERRRRRR